jgi:hypothetical protein
MHARQGEVLVPRLIEGGLRCGGVDVATHDTRAVAREHQGTTLTDTAAGTGDDRNFALKAVG